MESVETIDDRHCPEKTWGWEEWIVNNDLYCGKRLHFTKKGGSTSLHFHMKKHETMYVERGSFSILVIDTKTAAEVVYVLSRGDSLVIAPGTPHRIIASRLDAMDEDAVADSPYESSSDHEAILVEFSTHHEDDDSYRVKL